MPVCYSSQARSLSSANWTLTSFGDSCLTSYCDSSSPVCVISYILLHAARRTMAAAVVFLHPFPVLILAWQSPTEPYGARHSGASPSPSLDSRKREKRKHVRNKGKTEEKCIRRAGPARPPLLPPPPWAPACLPDVLPHRSALRLVKTGSVFRYR